MDSFKHIINDTVEDLKATRTLVPEVIATQTALNSKTTILAFNFLLTEYCHEGKMVAYGRYQNGNFLKDMDLFPGLVNKLDHLVQPFPPLEIGDYKYDTRHLRFAYNGTCEWFDDQTWKQCGECRAALWSRPELNCGASSSDASGSRVSFCSPAFQELTDK